MLDRREFLRACAALGLTSAAAPLHTQERPRFDTAPFALGVASGYPNSDGFVIWTRLVIDPTRGDGGLDPARIRLNWEAGTDQRLAQGGARPARSSLRWWRAASISGSRAGHIRRASK